MADNNNLEKLEAFTKSMPTLTDTQCLKLGLLDEIGNVLHREVMTEKNIKVRRTFIPKEMATERRSLSHVTLAIVYEGVVRFSTEYETITCERGGFMRIPPGVQYEAFGVMNSWCLFIETPTEGK